MDVYCPFTLIASALWNRLIPKVNHSINFSHDKPHAFKRIAAGYVGLVVAVVFSSFSCKKPIESIIKGTIDFPMLNSVGGSKSKVEGMAIAVCILIWALLQSFLWLPFFDI